MARIFVFILSFSLLVAEAEPQIYSRFYSRTQEMFLEAESFFLFEEFSEALPLYLELINDQPENAFLNYRAGLCHLNITGQKYLAIEFLEQAVQDIDNRNRRPTFRTTRAPLDALFYLANAYHINYRFDEAIELYNQFKDKLDPSVYDVEVVNDHIESSKNAIESIKSPVAVFSQNLGELINTRYSETNPVVSGNNRVLAFARELPFYNALFISERTGDGNWSWPEEITEEIGSDGDCFPVSLSYEGDELYLYRPDDLTGNIYLSRYYGERWSTIKKLNDNINTRFWESHASISADGKTLYFTSNRPGGYGGLDIYYSRRGEGDNWGPAINSGPVINTPYNENTPFISQDGNTLFFSSLGHYNIGGYDIFYSRRMDNGEWSQPVNAGYGINTPDDDLFFQPVNNGKFAYVARAGTEGSPGVTDIYRYELYQDPGPDKLITQEKLPEEEEEEEKGLAARTDTPNDEDYQDVDEIADEQYPEADKTADEPYPAVGGIADEQYPEADKTADDRGSAGEEEYPELTRKDPTPGIMPSLDEPEYKGQGIPEKALQKEDVETVGLEEENGEAEKYEEAVRLEDQGEEDVPEKPEKEEDITRDARKFPYWWLLLAGLVLAAVFYHREQQNRRKS